MTLIRPYIETERTTGVDIHTRSFQPRRRLTRSATSYGTTPTAAWRVLKKLHPA